MADIEKHAELAREAADSTIRLAKSVLNVKSSASVSGVLAFFRGRKKVAGDMDKIAGEAKVAIAKLVGETWRRVVASQQEAEFGGLLWRNVANGGTSREDNPEFQKKVSDHGFFPDSVGGGSGFWIRGAFRRR